MAIRYETLGQSPNHRRILIADTEAELLAEIPGTEIAEGYAKDTGINADYVQGAGWKVGGATKNPDGSISMSGPVRAPNVPHRLGRAIRLAAFGDSTADFINNPTRTDCEIPSVGAIAGTVSQTWDGAKATLLGRGPYLHVAAGGISGQTLTAMRARSSAAYSAGRKALEDVCSKSPDVILWHAGTINTTMAYTAATSDATILADAELHCQLARRAASYGPLIVDCGVMGYSAPANSANWQHVRRGNLMINAYIKEAAKSVPNWIFLDPVGVTCDDAGAFLPEVSGDGIHLTIAIGSPRLGAAEHEIVSLYYSGIYAPEDGTVAFDGAHEVVAQEIANPATLPSGYTISRTNVSNPAYTLIGGKIRMAASVSAASNTMALFRTGASVFAGVSSVGDGIAYVAGVRVFRASDGVEVTGYNVSARVYQYDETNANQMQTLSGVTGAGRPILIQAARAFAVAGSSSLLSINVSELPVGDYIYEFDAPRLYKFLAPVSLP